MEDYIELEAEGLEFDATLKDNPIMVRAYGIYADDGLLCADITKNEIEELMDRPGSDTIVAPYIQELFFYKNGESDYGDIDFVIPFSVLSDETLNIVRKICVSERG